MAANACPRFYIAIRYMKQENGTSGPSPPTWIGGNIDTNPLDRFLFFCNGDRIEPVERIPQQCQPYSTHSVYYQNERFWIVNYDAIDNPIGDDHLLEQRGTPDSDRWIGWCDLMFSWDNDTGISHATVAGGQPRLLQQHVDHVWPQILLPRQYHTETVTVGDREGGVNGEISLVIALVALTMYPTRFVPGAFQAGRWRLQDWISTWKDGGGVVVSVHCETDDDRARLRDYEWGNFGVVTD